MSFGTRDGKFRENAFGFDTRPRIRNAQERKNPRILYGDYDCLQDASTEEPSHLERHEKPRVYEPHPLDRGRGRGRGRGGRGRGQAGTSFGRPRSDLSENSSEDRSSVTGRSNYSGFPKSGRSETGEGPDVGNWRKPFAQKEQREFVPMGQRLRELEDKAPNQVLMALVSPRSGILKLYQMPKIKKDEQLESMVRLLEMACRAVHSPQSLSILLQSINDSGFIKGPLTEYCMARQVRDRNHLPMEFLINVIEVMKALMHHLPSHSSGNVTSILALMSSFASRGSGNDGEAAILKECLKAAEDMRQDIVKAIRGGDVVRDQDIGDKESEEPPDDFRKIPVMPTVMEIKSDEPPFLRKNIVFGAYRTVDHYLDVQYRLLREDFVCPLRDGLKMLLEAKEKNISLKKISDIRFYDTVQILTPYCTQKGIMYRARFDVTHFRRIRWESTKRLIFGSLVGLSKDNFESIIFGTVADRNPTELGKGVVDLFFEDESAYRLDPNPYTEYQMVECSAYFEAYRHVLQGLQEIQEGGLPFKKYILNQSSDVKEVDSPRYLRGQDAKYDMSCLLCESSSMSAYRSCRSVRVLDPREWPSADDLGLDASQYRALQTSITKEFVAIQGPPGTGKTFIGLKIVQLLLKNRNCWFGRQGNQSPILVVCYTNHALDQFLEGVLARCHLESGDLVRIGGRSASEDTSLQKCSLMEIKRSDRMAVSHDITNAIREVKQTLQAIQSQITNGAAQIECARKQLMHEMVLQRFMTHQQAGSLFRMARPDLNSLLPVWLGFGSGMFIPGFETEDVDEGKVEEEDLVEDDQEEVKRMQEERMVAIDETFESTKKQHLKQIKAMSEKCDGVIDISHTEEWEVAGKSKKKQKKQLLRQNLGFHNMMREDEARAVADVWNLSMINRWRLYNFWVSKLCEELALNVRTLNVEYNRLSSRLSELNMEDDFVYLQRASVIGMTTTGAAKYRQLLQRVHPKIVIVEEAAEVMEAHVITTLSSRCEHLIMIGDHQQLRPNPTVYKLAREFHLDISLFERMIKNEIHCDQLTIQHRMRPEIVRLIVPHIYKQLLNHESVLAYPDVVGIRGNVFFINHAFEENSVDDTKSRSNLHEAQYIACLAKYLLQQGYEPQQITVLTTYTGQMFLLRKTMREEVFKGIRTTPVDNFQGEENDIILLSLVRSNDQGKIGFLQTHNRVCVALSRAKRGLYVIGNIEMMAEAGVLWNAIKKDLKKDSSIVDALPLACQNHPDSVIHAKLPGDFSQAPEGGCMLDCGYRLDCGHVCQLKCHPVDTEHKKYKCTKPCIKTLCELGHGCPKLCHESCPKCKVLVEKIIPSCQHKQMVECHVPASAFKCREPCQQLLSCGHGCQAKCGSECSEKCFIITPPRMWPCGHELTVECFRNPDNFDCNEEVDRVLPCGHLAVLKCSTDVDLYPCPEEVEASLCADLDHVTKIPCHQRKEYLTRKCDKMVKVTCSRNPKHNFMQRCSEKESAMCPFKCEAVLACGHVCPGNCGVCSNQDGRHQSCRAHCSKKLMCNHACSGMCGQPCPPCGRECNLFCGHKKCMLTCGSLCEPCELPCRWSCPHEICGLPCKEPCARPPCNERCPRPLRCGHPCLGLCGELCPPLCGVCHRTNVLQLTEYLQVKNFSKKTRFVHLQPCGHVIEVDYMDKWVEDTQPERPCEATFLACPSCKQVVGFSPRYSFRIKSYMVDMNRIKEASQKSSSFARLSNAAASTLWPTSSGEVMARLLSPCQGDKPTGVFQRLALGALCIWQECQNVFQLCQRRNAMLEDESEVLDKVKDKLVESVDERDVAHIAQCIQVCKRLYLRLHALRMLTFIKNPRHIQTLETCVLRSRFPDDLWNRRRAFDWKDELKYVNQQLNMNFSAMQKENIYDFLAHLNEFFTSSVRSNLSIKRWLLCRNGHVFGVTDEKATTGDLNNQCLRCFPANDDVADTQVYGEHIDDVIDELLDAGATSRLKILADLQKERAAASSRDIMVRFGFRERSVSPDLYDDYDF